MAKVITYQTVCDTCRHRSVTAGALPCRTCEGYSAWEKPAQTEANRLRSTLAAHQLLAGTQIWRQQRALTPIFNHADSHAFAPPLKFSRDRCREIREEVERDR